MSPSEAKKNAAQFLKDQAAIMKKHGQAPKLSELDYQAALTETTRTFQSLSTARKAKE
jgi:hypothetical protein